MSAAGAGGIEPLLKVENLTVRAGPGGAAPAILDGVSLEVGTGETLGLVGESGSGKTTLGMAILRLLPDRLQRTAQGRILFSGEDVLAMDPRALTDLRGGRISMILQDPMASLNPVFSIGSQLREALRRHGTAGGSPGERAVRALAEMGIPSPESRLRAYPHQMSGGMRQRIVSAIALARAPELLIADEPTTSLDVTIQYQVLELLAELRRRLGMAMIFITHDFGVVARMCDRVAVMYAGEIVEQGPVRDIFQRPAHWYTQALLASVPRVGANPRRLATIAGTPPGVGARPEGCRFHPRCPRAEAVCRTPPEMVVVRSDHTVRCRFPVDAP